MSFRVVPRSDVPSAEWDAWVGVHPCGELWHLHYMQDVLAKRTQHEDRSFAVIDQRGELRGLMPLQHRRSGGLARVLGLSELSSLGGALIELSSPRQLREVQDVVTQGVRDAIEDSRSIRVHAELGVHLADLEPRAPTAVNPLVYLGFECGQKFSWVLDLRKSMEDLRRGYVKSARQELRKVEDTALAVREAGGGRDLEAYYSLHLDTYRRTKAMPHPFEYIEAIFTQCVPRGHSTILFAEAAGHVVSAHNTAHFKEVSLYWTGASASDAPVGANRLLFDRQIVGARSRSDLVFDCGEAFPSPRGPKERGLSTFKRSFGGVLWPRSAGTQVGMPVVDGLERAWRGVSNLLGTWRSS